MRILTGIQPTNLLHIGNYFGAVLPAVELAQEHEGVMMIADLHAITVAQNPAELPERIAFVAATYLAAGLDPARTILFQQSRVGAHAELAWLLQCVARIGEVERMTQYKDKAKTKGENVSVGLFTYPVLMAADILLYSTEGVPVGEDQKQHVELARDLAQRFNRDFSETFVVPKPMIRAEGAKILGLDNPEIKMSKSAASAKNYISLMDSADDVRAKIRAAVTDSQATITLEEGRPGVANLLTLLALSTGQNTQEVIGSYDGKGMKDLKDDVAEALIAFLAPIQERIQTRLADRGELSKILENGAERAHDLAAPMLARAKEHMGLLLK